MKLSELSRLAKLSKVIKIVDNGGETYDRYTVWLLKKTLFGYFYITFSENPYSLLGVCCSDIADSINVLDNEKVIKFTNLNESCQKMLLEKIPYE